MGKIVILDFSSAEVHVFSYDHKNWESEEDFLAKHNNNEGFPFSETNCQWMVTQKEQELDIVIH